MKNNETKLICSNCGAEIIISNHEHTVSNVTVVGKDSGLGTVAVPTKKNMSAAARLQALKDAGVDISNLFAINSANGQDMIIRLNEGVPSVVAEDDNIFKAILNDGEVPERRLFRRWIMSQIAHMETEVDWRTKKVRGFTKSLHARGYAYTFKMTEEELRVQAKLAEIDEENFKFRNRSFNKSVAVDMIEDYLYKLNKYIEKLKVKHCKNVPYKTIGGRNVYVDEIDVKVFEPLIALKNNVENAETPLVLWRAFRTFNNARVQLPYDTKQCAEWVDAYKSAGAYWTMKNLIMFHGCSLFINDEKLDKRASLEILEDRAKEYIAEGWRLFAMMRKMVADNGIDWEAKKREWTEARNNR